VDRYCRKVLGSRSELDLVLRSTVGLLRPKMAKGGEGGQRVVGVESGCTNAREGLPVAVPSFGPAPQHLQT
jgi:hypothetical protein